jgi:dTDP-4-amino-4,6-dideoxygalactose transaminase
VKYHHAVAGENCRLDGLQASILLAKLDFLDAWNEQRRRVALRYCEALTDSAVIAPAADQVPRSVWHLFVVQVEDREGFQTHLRQHGVESGIHYPIPIHLQPAYSHLGHSRGDFPVAESLAQRIVSLPVYPEMTEAQIEAVIDAVLSWSPAPISKR